MPTLTDRLAPKSDEIAAKVIDGEAIIINLTNGYYYSMVGTGTVVWEGVHARASVETIAAELSRRYDVSLDTATSDVHALVERLVHEELVTIAVGEAAGQIPEQPHSAERLPYTPPMLEKFGDMAHFFAVDPPLPELDKDLANDDSA